MITTNNNMIPDTSTRGKKKKVFGGLIVIVQYTCHALPPKNTPKATPFFQEGTTAMNSSEQEDII